MRARDQLIAAAVIAAATYGVMMRIAAEKADAAVGGGGFPLDDHRVVERDAFERVRSRLTEIGEGEFAARLGRMREDGTFWVAPALGPDRWAVFVETLRLVRRIYLRRQALLDPRAHLYPQPVPAIPEANQHAFAWISLAGALRHELAHFDGMTDEHEAYAAEIAWYGKVRQSPWFAALEGENRSVIEWALDSAVLTARSASARAAR